MDERGWRVISTRPMEQLADRRDRHRVGAGRRGMDAAAAWEALKKAETA